MRPALLALCAACGAAAPAPATPAAGRDVKFAIITVDRPSGSAELRVDPDGTWHSHLTFNDRGRGPDVTASGTFDESGALRTLTTTGHAYDGQDVDETLVDQAGMLRWCSHGEHGEARDGAGYYVPLQEGIASYAALVRACRHAAGRRVKLLPAGEAWIEDDRAIEVDLAGRKRTLHQVALSGFGFAPQLVWLDEHDQLFANVSAWLSMIQVGAEPLIPKLVAADNEWLAERNARLARTLAHRPPAAGLAITHAALFDAERKLIVPDQTVVVVGDRIAAVGDAHTAIPPGAQVIDAHGRTLVPGLWDMHVHIGDGDGILYLASGVTTIRDLGNDIADLVARARRFDDGSELGPHVLRAGLIDGPGKFAAPTGVLAATPEQARAAVDRYVGLGYVQIKIYSSVDPALVPVIAKAAHEHGLRVSGHIPFKMKASEAVLAGYDEIQHVNFLFLQFLAGPDDDTRTPLRYKLVAARGAELDLDGKDVQAFLDLLRDHHTVLDPTVSTFENQFTADPGDFDPTLRPYAGRLPAQVERGAHAGGLEADAAQRATFRASYAKLLDMVARAWKRGIPIVAGTDGTAGLQLSRELELYVEAGIPAPEVLALDTLGAARVMRVDKDTGSIAAGKRADLVLVDGDPTRDIAAVRDADVVVCRGVVYDPAELFSAIGMRPRP